MNKKRLITLIILILSICLITVGIYFKTKHDEREKEKEAYYKEQKERISLYLKYNTKEPNTIKNVDFTKIKVGPMGDVVFEGYINNNKNDDFVAYASPEWDYQFGGDLIESKKLSELLKPAHELKSPEEIMGENQ
ncbi:DUF1433 domain-containing protein [Macrococcoides canis]|uniref:DUF1433 domain-containing protein n=1 Tax=Macrococcoides canis TaxID=1855823 RepID=UPI0020B88065|nr:DUF1433 domain-containing protein [Macrococcus canis]UTH02288.1 DUF1433 domain-containing protein [Macrococcus canis]